MMMQRTANENAARKRRAGSVKDLIRYFTDPAFTGSIFVCGPLHHHVSLSSLFMVP